MESLRLKYRTYGKGLPPRPIRLEIPGWAGDTSKMENGSTPQPWHCNPFVEASTYGLELVYPYDTECQVVNLGGDLRIEWDFAREREAGVSGGEFVKFAPNHYGFNTSLDLQAPAGHVLRLEPHPRYFTDRSGTVPCAITGHLQTQWWPKLFFVAFKGPLAGERHVFRKGEAYAQVIVVPERATYKIEPMTADEAEDRLALESTLASAKDHIAEHIWADQRGQSFNNQYKVLTRIFHTAGADGVRRAIQEGMSSFAQLLPDETTAGDALARAGEFHQAGRFAEARAICYQVLEREPNHGEALHFLANSALQANRPMMAVECLEQAVAAHPSSVRYWNDFGLALLAAGRTQDSLQALTRALQIEPNRAVVRANLAQSLCAAGRVNESLAKIEEALAAAPADAVVCYRAGGIYERIGKVEDARRFYAQALAANPNFTAARRRLDELQQSTPAQE